MSKISEKPQPAHTQPARPAVPVTAASAARPSDHCGRVPAGRSGEMVAVYYAFIVDVAGRERYIRRSCPIHWAADRELMTDGDRFTEDELRQLELRFDEDVVSRYCCHIEMKGRN